MVIVSHQVLVLFTAQLRRNVEGQAVPGPYIPQVQEPEDRPHVGFFLIPFVIAQQDNMVSLPGKICQGHFL